MSTASLYETLENGSIRVLKLEGTQPIGTDSPKRFNLAIVCSLHTVSLESVKRGEISYRALSYTWGYPHTPRSILCNGIVKPVTQNLYDALLQFVEAGDAVPDYLWVDAICINQSELREKSQQVASMGSIFREAELVLVWLGSGAALATDLFESEVWEDSNDIKLRRSKGEKDANAWANDRELDVEPLRKVRAFLTESEWYGRMWTFQEIIAARYATICCGPFQVGWHTLMWHFSNFSIDNSSLSELAFLRDHREGDGALHLHKLLEITSFRRSANPLDTVYALLGLYRGDHKLRPDYEQTPLQLCATVTKIVAEELGYLLLGTEKVEISTKPTDIDSIYTSWLLRTDRLPSPVSWITDWTKRTETRSFVKPFFLHEYKHIHPSFKRNIRVEGTTLKVRGLILGKLDDYSGKFGGFSRLPKCVYPSGLNEGSETSTNVDVDLPSDEIMTKCPDGTEYLGSSYIARKSSLHACGKCTCSRGPKIMDELSSGSSPNGEMMMSEAWLCVLFGCPDMVVLCEVQRSNGRSSFGLLGTLDRRTSWARVLENVASPKEGFTSQPLELMIDSLKSTIAGARIVRPAENLDSRIYNTASNDQRLSWIPTHFNIAGELPQTNPCIWKAVTLNSKSYQDAFNARVAANAAHVKEFHTFSNNERPGWPLASQNNSIDSDNIFGSMEFD